MTTEFDPPRDGTEQRLDALLAELRGLRAELGRLAPVAAPVPPAPDQVRLEEPAVRPRGGRPRSA